MVSKPSIQPTATAATKVTPRIILVVFFFLQIFAAVGLTAYLSLRNRQKTVNQLASQLRTEVSDRISQQLDHYLAIPYQIVKVLYKLAMLGNMGICHRAADLEQLDEKYIPFAYRLDDLAREFQEKAIVALVEKYLELEEAK